MRKDEIIEMLQLISIPYPIDEETLRKQIAADIDRLKTDLVLRYKNATNISREKQRQGIKEGEAFFDNSLQRALACTELEELLKNCIMIRKYVLLKIDYKLTGKKQGEEEKYLEIQKACRSLSEIPSILNDLSEVELVEKNSDWENSNLSKYAYQKPKNEQDNLYGVSVRLGRVKRFLPETLNPKGIYAYRLGTLKYGQFANEKGGYTYNSEPYALMGVAKKTKDGEMKKYVGLIALKDGIAKPEFYADIVFSDVVLENAMENNFGYIGTIESDKGSDYGCRLVFEDLDIRNTITALSYATEKGFLCDDAEITNLNQLYAYILENALSEDNIKEMEDNDKSELGDG